MNEKMNLEQLNLGLKDETQNYLNEIEMLKNQNADQGYEVELLKRQIEILQEEVTKSAIDIESFKNETENIRKEAELNKNETEKCKQESQILLIDIASYKEDARVWKSQAENLQEELEKASECSSDQLENISFGPTEIIVMSLIRQIEETQEIDICAGLSTSFGYFTAKLCCQADQKYLFDSKTYEELTFDENSMWIDENICFINTTEISRISVPSLDFEGKQICSIVTFDEFEGQFNEFQLDLEIKPCFNTSCSFSFDVDIFQNETILNGTSVSCRQSNHYGIVTKGKYQGIFCFVQNCFNQISFS